MSITRLIFTIYFLAFNSVAAHSRSIIQWDYNNRATVKGSGCSTQDVYFIKTDNEISIVFSRLGVELTGHAGGKLEAKKACRLIIPTKILKGFYLAELSQTLTYGYNRTEGTKGKIYANTMFYNQKAGRFKIRIPSRGYDTYDEPFAEARHTNRWSVGSERCTGKPYKGKLKAKFAVSGTRDSINEDIVVQIDGHDIRFDVSGKARPCP